MSSALIALINLLFALHALFVPSTLTFDAANPVGEVTGGASGFLYGVAEEGVPSQEITDSLRVTSISAKTAGGLQHPVGDVHHIAPQLTADDSLQYILIYLQDMYSTWYYDEEAINAQKRDGTYDWQRYLHDVYFPILDEALSRYEDCDYFDQLVFCPFNECDNAVWFGEWIDGWNQFSETGQQNFFLAFRETADRIKAKFPTAKIAGPAYCAFNPDAMRAFLAFTKENDCLPDVLVYHELNDRSILEWNLHVSQLHEIERGLGIPTDLPVIVNEYGMMEENGDPNAAAKYISVIEESGTFGNQAYWLLANNLSNTCADQNSPNSAWWVYHRYAEMYGWQRLALKTSALPYSDRYREDANYRAKYKDAALFGIGARNESGDRLSFIVSGSSRCQTVRVTHLNRTALRGKMLRVTVQKVTYQGIGGAVFAPETLVCRRQKCTPTLNIPLTDRDKAAAYFIFVEDAAAAPAVPVTKDRFTRFEFEDGTLLGRAYTYDSAYATTGETAGMVGGFEAEGDGVTCSFCVPATDTYELKLIYGKYHDGLPDSERRAAKATLLLDGEAKTLSLPNTVKSENTGALRLFVPLKAGRHSLTLLHDDGTFVVDSFLLRRARSEPPVFFERVAAQNGRFLVIAPQDGYYDADDACLFLKRGLNILERDRLASVTPSAVDLERENRITDRTLFGTANEQTDENGVAYLDGFDAQSGVRCTFDAPEDGAYALVLTYASGRENGTHAYNIDLVEDFVTLSVDGEKRGNYYCRNTMSFTSYTTVTIPLSLAKGPHELTLTNDGENAFDGTGHAPRIAQIRLFKTNYAKDDLT